MSILYQFQASFLYFPSAVEVISIVYVFPSTFFTRILDIDPLFFAANTSARLALPPDMTETIKLVDESFHWCDNAIEVSYNTQ